MARKRQQDFSKTKLRPGRPIKRKTTFDSTIISKKISVQTKTKSSEEISISDCLKCLKGTYTAARLNALERLKCVVKNREDSFLPYLAEVLEILSKIFLETDPNVRNLASNIICLIISKSSESEIFKMKLKSFSPLLTNIISCGMSHTVSSVKENTLKILSSTLTYYPDLVCNSLVLLKYLLNLITTRRKPSYKQPMTSKSSLATVSDNVLVYDNWRISILKTMNMFLKEMLRKYETDVHLEEVNEDNEVYWNAESPLHLQIFAGSGLKPIDIEKPVNGLNSPVMDFEDPSIIEDFILPVLNEIPVILRGEIGGKKKGDDCPFSISTIKNLNVILQLLYHITEWIQVMSCEEMEKKIRNILLRDIYEHNLFPFHSSAIFSPQNQIPEVTELNLTLCLLHGKLFLHSDEDNSYTTSSLLYIKSIFDMPYETKYNFICTIAKILKMYYGSCENEEISDFIVYSLSSLSIFLETIDDGHNKDALISLFMKLSLHPAYEFLSDSLAMRNWFKWLLKEFFNIPKTGEVNKNLLRITKMIANRKYPYFLTDLSQYDSRMYKTLLKYNDPLVRDTAIFLIYNMEEVKESLLEDISNLILLDSTFPQQFAIRLIRLLTSKFTKKPGLEDVCKDRSAFRRGRTNFVLFLLNIAIDSLNVNSENLLDYNDNEYAKAMESFKDVTTYNVIPSLKWKDHAKLFKVSQQSLCQLPKKIVDVIAIEMFKEILDCHRNLPMHCVIAIMKLTLWNVEDRHYHYLMNSLVFSSLMTSSILISISSPEDEWFLYNSFELMGCIQFSRNMALETLQDQLENGEEIDSLTMYHIMRIIAFYLEKSLFKRDDGDEVLNILKYYKDKCTDKAIEQQPLYQSLFNIFCYYG